MAIRFVGPATRLKDTDLPRIGTMIGVGEDELHAFIDVETKGRGFDGQGRPVILFEPHVFYRNLPASLRPRAVSLGLACKSWGQLPYGKESEQYGKLMRAIAIHETAALKAASYGMGQVLGENHVAAGYETVQDMVDGFRQSEAVQLEGAVSFIKANNLDDELRVLAALKRPTTPDDCRAFVRGYNGSGYEKNDYHTQFAAAHNRWRGIKDTPWSPPGPAPAPTPAPSPAPPVAEPAPTPGFWRRFWSALTKRLAA